MLPLANSSNVPATVVTENMPILMQEAKISEQHQSTQIDDLFTATGLSDSAFFKRVLTQLATCSNPLQVNQILKHPDVSTRLNTLVFMQEGTKSSVNMLKPIEDHTKCLIEFLQHQPACLNQKSVQKFIASQCVRLHASLDLLALCQIELRYFKDIWITDLDKLTHSLSLPKSIQGPLKALASHFIQVSKMSASKLFSIQKDNFRKFENSAYSYAIKMLAIQVADQVDGGDFKEGGIRLWIHQPPRGVVNRAADLIIKHIQDFRSGRRGFIFEKVQQVPLQNYKEVMLYVIHALQKDREVYYQDHKDYIDPILYQKVASILEEEKNIFSQHLSDERYQFEWAAQKLMTLKEKLIHAHSNQDIKEILDQFKHYYRLLSNFNMDLTICSCIDSNVFSFSHHLKPIIHQGVPTLLRQLAQAMSILSDFSLDVILQDFAKLSSKTIYYPSHAQEAIDKLEIIYKELLQQPLNKELMQAFYSCWQSIPLVDSLTDNYTSTFIKFICKIEEQLGISKKTLDQLLRSSNLRSYCVDTGDIDDQLDTIASNCKKKYPSLFQPSHFDPEKTLNDLKLYQEELTNLKLSYLQKNQDRHLQIFNQHPIGKELTKIEAFLSKDKTTIDYEKYKLNFDKFKKKASQAILVPFPGIAEKITAFKQALNMFANRSSSQEIVAMNKESEIFSNFEHVFEKLVDLKHFLMEEALPCKTLASSSYSAIFRAMDLIENIEIALAEQLVAYDSQKPASLRLLIHIAQEQGFLSKHVKDLPSLKQIWQEETQERLRGYASLRRQLINTPLFLHLLLQQNISIDEAIQTILSRLNTGCGTVLDRFITEQIKSQQNLLGHATQPANVLGKLRIVLPDQDFKAAQEGEILAIPYASPEVHKYAHASAIISEQGGLFSHAAITFSDLGIPALLGCSIQDLKPYDGQMIHLHLSDTPSLKVLDTEIATHIQNITTLNLENAKKIESLPKEIGEIVAQRFYKEIFNTLPVREIIPFLAYSYAKNYLEQLKQEIKDLEKCLWKAGHPLERGYFVGHLEKKLNLLRKIAEGNPLALEQIDADTLNMHQKQASLNIQRIKFGTSGKKLNLDRLKAALASFHCQTLQLNIPSYQSFNAEELVWSQNLMIKHEMAMLLEADLPIAEKSQQIEHLIAQLTLDEEALLKRIELKGDLIVRSSAGLEDQCQNSAAGIFISIKINSLEEIKSAFLKVLASAFSEKALVWFAKSQLNNKALLFDMTWIVQNYVADGDYSGVAFSVAHKKEWNTAGVQIVQGLGGGVDGKENPMHALIDTRNQTFVDLYLQKGKDLPCSRENLKEIASLMKQLEKHFQAPVEIEFVGKEKRLSIVQLRPITI